MAQKVLSYDLGGTKVAAGVVNDQGKILKEIRVPVYFEKGKNAVIAQLAQLGNQLLEVYPEIKKVGIASAGPLEPTRGILLDPTNFSSEKGAWGKTPLAQILSKKLKREVFLENDAAASVLAEHWVGAGKKFNNVMILTLGTGLGTGIICNGLLVRSGQNLHPEAGHLIIKANDATAPCGCGNLGCAEAYLSGRNFSRRTSLKWGEDEVSAQEIADLARRSVPRAKSAFGEYAEMMAITLYNYLRIYSPEIFILTGSFAEASDLFLDQTKSYLKNLMTQQKGGHHSLPKLALSQLNNRAGLIGGAYVAFAAKKRKTKAGN